MVTPDKNRFVHSHKSKSTGETGVDSSTGSLEEQCIGPLTESTLSFNEAYAIRRLPDASLLLAQQGKRLRNSINILVHGFRNAHGIEGSGLMGNQVYSRILDGYLSLEHTVTANTVVEALMLYGTAEGYAEVRQAGRMRKSAQELSETQLTFLAGEIRAAIIWRASFDSNKAI